MAKPKAEKLDIIIPDIESEIKADHTYKKVIKGKPIEGELVGEKPHLPILKARFLRNYISTGGQVLKSCKLSSVAQSTFYSWVRRDPTFAEALEAAKYKTVSVLEGEVIRRAFEGVDRPLHYKGFLTGDTVKDYSDLLLMFRLKYLVPEYNDKHNLIGIQSDSMTITFVEPAAKPKQLLSAPE